ncbi:MAG: hypothetical protein Q4A66_01490 [Eubacteriales bacterium]|nr:hypothetical protein [Eubacteriales bacterium]
MTTRDLWGYRAELDEQATREWYARAGEWNCACGHCRNFLALARTRALPPYVLEVLDSLGIPPEKATYVCELFTDAAGAHYQFSYRVAGVLVALPEQEDAAGPSKGRCCQEPYPYGAPGFPAPHFDLEFYAALPWVLNEDPNGPTAADEP